MSRIFANAAVNGVGTYTGKGYFLLDDIYVRFDWAADQVNDGYPLPMALWNLPIPFNANVDAALDGQGPYAGKTYFFKGSQYVRFDWTANTLDAEPKPLTAWPLSGEFVADLDSAINGQCSRAGKAYFFKGSHYARYDWATNKIDETITSLANFGLTGDFAKGIDFALEGIGPHAGKAYFFKGRQYVRFDWAGMKLDESPRDIKDGWPGVFQMLCAGTGKTRALAWIGAARDRLDPYIASLNASVAGVDNSIIESALATQFHVDKAWAAAKKRPYLETIRATFDAVVSALGDSPKVCHFHAGGTGVAFTGTVNGVRGVYYDPGFLDFGPLCQTAMVVHEPVHYTDPKAVGALGHYEWGPEYDKQSADDALHCPSSYASFSQNIYYGSDTRYGAGKKDL